MQDVAKGSLQAQMSDFLRNSRKYGLGSLRKTLQGGRSPYRPRSLVRQLALKPTTNQPSTNGIQMRKMTN